MLLLLCMCPFLQTSTSDNTCCVRTVVLEDNCVFPLLAIVVARVSGHTQRRERRLCILFSGREGARANQPPTKARGKIGVQFSFVF